MTEQAAEIDVKELVLSGSPFGPSIVGQIAEGLGQSAINYRPLREAVQELERKGTLTPADKVRLGVAYFLLGRYAEAAGTLSSSDGGALSLFYLAKSYDAQGRYPEAVSHFQSAAKAGYSATECALGKSHALRMGEDPTAALAVLDNLSGAVEQTADYLAERAATVAKMGGSPGEVVALYERAVQADPTHPAALFGLAMENDRRGNDDEALEYYRRAATRYPAHLGSLLNLGIMYEDRNQFDRAQQCYQRILDIFPNQPRARLFFKDSQASADMYYDEDAARRRDKLGQLLSIPVTDFELSVRSRNCLQKMGIMTLGDLSRTTEQELLASKNFGETSLTEIKDMMVSKGLSLGQFAAERPDMDFGLDSTAMSADEQALLGKPVGELNLSVRARKCMIRLGMSTIGDLVRRTGDELLECKNFGVTSLNEVREKLMLFGLKLRGD